MNWDSFINKIVDVGIEAAKRDYKHKSQQFVLDGSVAGFKACRNKSVSELPKILQEAQDAMNEAIQDSGVDVVWYARGFLNEVGWVCNVVSAALYNQKLPVIIQPTARGMQAAANILGVSEDKKGAN